MAHREDLSDIIVLRICEVHYTKSTSEYLLGFCVGLLLYSQYITLLHYNCIL